MTLSSDENTAETGRSDDLDVLNAVLGALQPLSQQARARVIQTVATFFELDVPSSVAIGSESVSVAGRGTFRPPFSQNRTISAKQFLVEKQPRTDVERIACLAYYLTHYQDMAHFKTLDLSKLNTEAAQPKFSNAAWASNNALKMGYLAPAARGYRQLSAGGEQFVNALPDRDAAKAMATHMRPRRRLSRRVGERNEGQS
jgi:hypothetical protein